MARKSTSVDPVQRYARDVMAGRMVAGKPVRLACERHLKDLKNGSRAPGSPGGTVRALLVACILLLVAFARLDRPAPPAIEQDVDALILRLLADSGGI